MSKAVEARSNKQTELLFVTATTTHADRIYGGGFGAFAKMIDRVAEALMGVPAYKCHLEFDAIAARGTVTNRETGATVDFTYVELA
jgi:hypothetical protein